MIVEFEQPGVGPVKTAGSPFHLSETPGGVYSPAPLLGQHTVSYLEEELGYSREKIEEILNEEVVFCNSEN